MDLTFHMVFDIIKVVQIGFKLHPTRCAASIIQRFDEIPTRQSIYIKEKKKSFRVTPNSAYSSALTIHESTYPACTSRWSTSCRWSHDYWTRSHIKQKCILHPANFKSLLPAGTNDQQLPPNQTHMILCDRQSIKTSLSVINQHLCSVP